MTRLFAPALIACGVGCSTPHSPQPIVLGEPPSERFEPSRGASAQTIGPWQVDFDPVLATVRSMRGSGITLPGTNHAQIQVVEFVRAHPELFGTDDFIFDGAVSDATLTTIMLAQEYRGLPVIGGHLGFAISHGKLTLVHGSTYPIRELDIRPRFAAAAALAVVRDGLPPKRTDRDDARLVVLPVRSPNLVEYHLAWEVHAWRGIDQAVVYVDAHRGGVIHGYDAHRYEFETPNPGVGRFKYDGIAKNNVDERTVGDSVVNVPASHLMLRSSRGNTALTDGDGAFAFRGEVAGPLFVNANLQGAFVNVQNLQGENATFVGVMRPETQYKLEWTETRSQPEERDVFRGTTTTNRFVSTVYPDLPWMSHPLLAKVNHNRYCNAFWNGSSINFFVEGAGCNNSGRIFDVVAHEWGHGFDQNAPGGAVDGALGEFIGDLMSFVQTKSPLLGPNFFKTGGAVRNMEDPTYDCFDPEIRQVHAGGNLLGNVVWDIMNDLEKAGVTGEALKRRLLRPIAIAQTRSEWYAGMLAVDDDNGNLLDGTPNECLIYAQFEAHSCKGHRWPGRPDRAPEHCKRVERLEDFPIRSPRR
jgi:hypothetical protein